MLMREPTVREAKWLYWTLLVVGALIGVVLAVVYGVPLLLAFLLAAVNAMAGVLKGHYDDV